MARFSSPSTTDKAYPIEWLVDLCEMLWSFIRWVWVAVIVSGLVSAFVTWLADRHAFDATFKWIQNNLTVILPVTISLVFLSVLIWVVSLLPAGTSQRKMRRRYLSRLVRDNVVLGLAGMPSGLVMNEIYLEQVFIRPLFHPAPATENQALSMDEQALLQDIRLVQRIQQTRDITRLREEARRELGIRATTPLGISGVWENFTARCPAVVIQGCPGSGKSTFLNRITLCMARRSLGKPESDSVLSSLTPALLPLFVSLGEFDKERKSNRALTLLSFLQQKVAQKINMPTLTSAPFVQDWLESGRCLVMFDGLDEVSDRDERKQVQEAITAFIQEYRSDEQRKQYNIFLITTRIAGYDTSAFAYPNYLIADLQKTQIEEFLPRWCRANLNPQARGISPNDSKRINEVVESSASAILRAIQTNPGVQRLAEVPLLLTLMIAMSQKDIPLPRNRAELYKNITEMLLKTRNEAKHIEQLDIPVALQRLGPLAYRMHDEENSLMLEQDVLDSFAQTIYEQERSQQRGGVDALDEKAQQEKAYNDARIYLDKVSERGGLFIKRVSDFYGFFHRTFEEYFAARYKLDTIERAADKTAYTDSIENFITQVREQDALWREPYLLAVAHKSEDYSYNKVAYDLISTLFHTPPNATEKTILHDLLLATTAIIESKSVEPNLQRNVADALLQHYHKAFTKKEYKSCEEIEKIVQQWLLTLGENVKEAALLTTLYKTITDDTHITCQRSTLTLLSIIAGQLISSPCEAIFDTLVPPLLALAGLPTIASQEKSFSPASHLAPSNDLTVQDLALTALSFMGRRGPAGVLLAQTRADFERFVPQLARYSLDEKTLITPTLIPLSNDNYRPYEDAFAQWITLRDAVAKKPQTTDADRARCEAIQRTLLAHAEEVNYLTALTMLELLQASQGNNDWNQVKHTWQKQLLASLNDKNIPYLTYFDTILFYNSLFVEEEVKPLASLLKKHFKERAAIQLFATRFLAYLADDLRVFQDLRDLRDLRYLRDLQGFPFLRFSRFLRFLRDLQHLRDFRDLQHLRDFRDLQDFLLTDDITYPTMSRLNVSSLAMQSDLLLIVLGRVLHIEEQGIVSKQVEQEIQGIVQGTRHYLASPDSEVRYMAREIEAAAKRVLDRVR